MLISIEGSDASGKETQSKMLYEYFVKKDKSTRLISFPNYNSESSSLVKMYLRGEFGNKPEDVNPMASSIFFACDRFASYRKDWGEAYQLGSTIITDRYTTSNIIHQGAKIDKLSKRRAFIKWLLELEYGVFGLPSPDITIFLNMPSQMAIKLIEKRANKFSANEEKDIHESDNDYLDKVSLNALGIANELKWEIVRCVNKNGELKTIIEIHEEILKIINKYE